MITTTRLDSPTAGPKVTLQGGFKEQNGSPFSLQVAFQFPTKAREDEFIATFNMSEAWYACGCGALKELISWSRDGRFRYEPAFFSGKRVVWKTNDEDDVAPYTWLMSRHIDLIYSSPNQKLPNVNQHKDKPFQQALLRALWEGGEISGSLAPSVPYEEVKSITFSIYVRTDPYDRRKVLTMSAGVLSATPEWCGPLDVSTLQRVLNGLHATEQEVKQKAEDMPLTSALLYRGAAETLDEALDEAEKKPVEAPAVLLEERTKIETGFYFYMPFRALSRWLERLFWTT